MKIMEIFMFVTYIYLSLLLIQNQKSEWVIVV
jgi:hypothetical protein